MTDVTEPDETPTGLTGWLRRRARRSDPVVDLDDPVRGALKDAQVLLAFAVQSRRSVKKELVAALNATSAAIQARIAVKEVPTAAELSAFWSAYDDLAVDAAPLSAQSIRESMEFTAKRFPASLWTATSINAFIAIAVFFACIALQVLWGAGQELLNKADAVDKQKLEVQKALRQNQDLVDRRETRSQRIRRLLCSPDPGCELMSAAALAAPSPKNGASAPKMGAEEQTRLRAELKTLEEEIDDKAAIVRGLVLDLQQLNELSSPLEATIANWHGRAMKICSIVTAVCPIDAKEAVKPDALTKPQPSASAPSPTAKPPSASASGASGIASYLAWSQTRKEAQDAARAQAQKQANDFRDKVQQIRLILASLANYWIPMIMGLLGALAFILRSLTIQLRDHTYVPASVSVNVIRMCLGTVAGVFGSLLAPSSEGALKGLPPLFIPFVFGYGIEILFSVMDRVVSSFTQTDSGGSKVRAAT